MCSAARARVGRIELEPNGGRLSGRDGLARVRGIVDVGQADVSLGQRRPRRCAASHRVRLQELVHVACGRSRDVAIAVGRGVDVVVGRGSNAIQLGLVSSGHEARCAGRRRAMGVGVRRRADVGKGLGLLRGGEGLRSIEAHPVVERGQDAGDVTIVLADQRGELLQGVERCARAAEDVGLEVAEFFDDLRGRPRGSGSGRGVIDLGGARDGRLQFVDRRDEVGLRRSGQRRQVGRVAIDQRAVSLELRTDPSGKVGEVGLQSGHWALASQISAFSRSRVMSGMSSYWLPPTGPTGPVRP